MKRRTKRIIGAIVVIAAIAAGGAAFTAGNTVPDTVAGYGTSNITGATVTALHYTLNARRHADHRRVADVPGRPDRQRRQGRLRHRHPDHVHRRVVRLGTDTTPATCIGYTQSTATSATFNVAVTNS